MKLIFSFWLLLVSSLFLHPLAEAAQGLSTPPRENQRNIVYDAITNSVVGYDGTPVLASGEKNNGTAGDSVLFAKFAGFLAADTAVASKPFAMGLDAELDSFAQARGATTWKQFSNPESWKSGVLDKLADPNTPVHFNLNDVDVWGGVQRAASGGGGATDWELLQLRQNPQFWDSTTFWKNGQIAPNPF